MTADTSSFRAIAGPVHVVGGSALHWRAVDPTGFGLTPRAGRRAGVEPGQQLLARLLRATDAQPAVLVGHSMGPAVAVLQAVRDPRSVRALVLARALLPPSYAGMSDPRRALTRRPGLARSFGEAARSRSAS